MKEEEEKNNDERVEVCKVIWDFCIWATFQEKIA